MLIHNYFQIHLNYANVQINKIMVRAVVMTFIAFKMPFSYNSFTFEVYVLKKLDTATQCSYCH